MNRSLTDTQESRLHEAAGAHTDTLFELDRQLRPPVHTLLEAVQQALEQTDSEQQRQHLVKIQACGRRLLHRLNNLLDLSRLEQGTLKLQPQNFQLSALLDELSQEINSRLSQRPVVFRMNLDERLPDTLYGDPRRIKQLISCFTDNAIRFTREGKISLQIRMAARNRKSVRLHCIIEDTGPGLPPELQLSLFHNPETTLDTAGNTRSAGTGLRLARLLARLMHGDAGIITPRPSGAAFWFSLQLPPAQRPEAISDQASAENTGFTADESATHVLPALYLRPGFDVSARQLLNDLHRALLQEDFNSLRLVEQHGSSLKKLMGADALRLHSVLNDFDFRRARAILELACSGQAPLATDSAKSADGSAKPQKGVREDTENTGKKKK